MNKVSVALSSLLLMVSGSVLAATNAHTDDNDLSKQPLEKTAPWPAAKAGMNRQVIWLPPRKDEVDVKVELLIGKTMTVDCNRVLISGKLESKTLKGFGYNYLELDKLSPPASTMMGCPENSKTEKFISANLGDAALQRYNSRLPMVIYVPEGVTVKYRLWQASETVQEAVHQ